MPEYFSHDYDAREDGKIIDLMGERGWQGYGLFWGLVELLYKNNGKMRTQYKRIAFALNSHPETIQDIVENYGLFQVKKDFFTSKSIIKRLSKRKEKSEVARANAYKRWNKDDANAMPTGSESNAKKESKVKESKDIYRAFAHLSISEIEFNKLINLGYTKQQVDSTIDSVENFKGNTKYKSLYLTVKKWLEKEPKSQRKTW